MPELRRLKLIISYNGCDFAGWQSQKHGNTIQDKLEEACAKICGVKVNVIGAGRTDAGVHALGQCAHVDVPAQRFKALTWLKALNGTLPATIRVLRASFVPENFHARFSARGKLYRYRIANSAILSPFELDRAWHVASALDLALLKQSAALFVGRHDFAGFCASRGASEANTKRTIESVRVTRKRELIAIEIWGEGFLYKMARMMVGGMVRVASGKEPLESIRMRLQKGRRVGSTLVAPAAGLYLVKISY